MWEGLPLYPYPTGAGRHSPPELVGTEPHRRTGSEGDPVHRGRRVLAGDVSGTDETVPVEATVPGTSSSSEDRCRGWGSDRHPRVGRRRVFGGAWSETHSEGAPRLAPTLGSHWGPSWGRAGSGWVPASGDWGPGPGTPPSDLWAAPAAEGTVKSLHGPLTEAGAGDGSKGDGRRRRPPAPPVPAARAPANKETLSVPFRVPPGLRFREDSDTGRLPCPQRGGACARGPGDLDTVVPVLASGSGVPSTKRSPRVGPHQLTRRAVGTGPHVSPQSTGSSFRMGPSWGTRPLSSGHCRLVAPGSEWRLWCRLLCGSTRHLGDGGGTWLLLRLLRCVDTGAGRRRSVGRFAGPPKTPTPDRAPE